MTIRSVAALIGAISVLQVAGPAAAADPLEIPALLPNTGGAAFIGKEFSDTLRVIEDQVNKSGGINGRQIHFAIQDDQSSPQVTVQLTNAVLAKNPPVIIEGGPLALCAAVAQLVKDGPLMYCLSPSMRVNSGDYIFSVMATPRDSLIAVMDYFKSRGLKRIAILNGTDATGADGDNILADIIKLPQFASMTYVANEHFNPGDLSVSAQITRIKASGAQVLIAYTTGAPTATVLHGMADGSLDIPVTTSAGNMSVAQLDSYKSFVPKELLFPAYPAQAVDPVADAVVLQRINDFKAAMKSISATPDLLHAIPWDATWLVVEALRRLRPAATAAQIRTSLAAVTNWPGMLGRYDFRAIPNRGLGPKALVMERWDPARSVWVLAK